MIVSEINPFIRYAGDEHGLPKTLLSRAYDCRLLYMVDGSCPFFIDGYDYTISKGMLLIWPSGHSYRFGGCENARLILLNFDYTQSKSSLTQTPIMDFEENYNPDKLMEKVSFEDCPTLNEPLILSNMKYLEDEIVEIYDELRQRRIFCQSRSSAILKKIITEAARKSLSDDSSANEIVEQAIAYISENYSSDISNKDIAGYVHYHEYYVSKLMEKHTGMTLHRYLSEYRVKIAAKLIRTTQMPVSEIAVQTGFQSTAYFAYAFGRVMGCSPSEFRRNMGNKI